MSKENAGELDEAPCEWWEHLKWGSTDCKFQQALKEFDIIDWIFEVIELVEDKKDLNDREAFYIKEYDSIENGYNSATVNGKEEIVENE